MDFSSVKYEWSSGFDYHRTGPDADTRANYRPNRGSYSWTQNFPSFRNEINSFAQDEHWWIPGKCGFCFGRCGGTSDWGRVYNSITRNYWAHNSNEFSFFMQPTHAKIPHEGYTTFNFVNTLPCSIHINYTGHDNGEITINATGFAFERDLSDEPLHLTVRLVDEECLNLGVAQWSGVIQGESTKVFQFN